MITYTLSETNKLTPLKTSQARLLKETNNRIPKNPFSGANLLLFLGGVLHVLNWLVHSDSHRGKASEPRPPKKKLGYFPLKYWMVNRDPYVMVYYIPYITG